MNFLQQMNSLAYLYLTRIIFAGIALIIGYFLVKTLKAFTFKILDRLKIDATLLAFLKSLLRMSYYILLFMLILTIAGIPSTYFAGMLVGLGTAIGFGLKDEFKTVSSGIIILITKPFKIGDTIKINDYTGTVVDIQLFQTVLRTPENLNIFLNNGIITTNGIIKLSDNEIRRQDIVIGVSYNDDINKVKEILKEIVGTNKYTLKNPEPLIALKEYAGSSINFLIRIWTRYAELEEAQFSINEGIKTAFDKTKITIPFPQYDINIKKNL